MLKNVNSFLFEHSYEHRRINNGMIRIYFKSENNIWKVIVITYMLDGIHISSEEYAYNLMKIKESFEKRNMVPIEMLSILVVEDAEKTVGYSNDQSISHWIYEITSNKLMVFENDKNLFDDLKQVFYSVERNKSREKTHDRAKKKQKEKLAFQFPIMTVLLVLINCGVFLAIEYFGSSRNADDLLKWGACYYPYVLENAEYYRLFTSMFIHIGISHLINNMIVLAFVGYYLERCVGKINFLILYFVSGLMASGASFCYYVFTQQQVISAGASGAIFGVVGSLAFLVLTLRGKGVGLNPNGMIAFILMSLYAGFTSKGTDNVAHVVGFLFGVLLAYILKNVNSKHFNLKVKTLGKERLVNRRKEQSSVAQQEQLNQNLKSEKHNTCKRKKRNIKSVKENPKNTTNKNLSSYNSNNTIDENEIHQEYSGNGSNAQQESVGLENSKENRNVYNGLVQDEGREELKGEQRIQEEVVREEILKKSSQPESEIMREENPKRSQIAKEGMRREESRMRRAMAKEGIRQEESRMRRAMAEEGIRQEESRMTHAMPKEGMRQEESRMRRAMAKEGIRQEESRMRRAMAEEGIRQEESRMRRAMAEEGMRREESRMRRAMAEEGMRHEMPEKKLRQQLTSDRMVGEELTNGVIRKGHSLSEGELARREARQRHFEAEKMFREESQTRNFMKEGSSVPLQNMGKNSMGRTIRTEKKLERDSHRPVGQRREKGAYYVRSQETKKEGNDAVSRDIMLEHKMVEEQLRDVNLIKETTHSIQENTEQAIKRKRQTTRNEYNNINKKRK